MIEICWQVTHKGDVRCRKMADQHYTRQNPGHPMWTRPGYNYVLYAEGESGQRAVWCWWRPKWEAGQGRFDGLTALECTIFRNESGALSSNLIREAVACLRRPEARKELSHPSPESILLLTGVSSKKTAARRSKRSLPGECFRRAGWKDYPHKKGRADIWLALEP
jgi:hypothetical protein